MLTILDHIPDGLLDCKAQDLHQVLSGPTLIQLPGRRPRPLFVSVLLHGNETTGLEAVQILLKKYQDQVLPRELCIFIGNITAAEQGQRHLPTQLDYNRIWPYPGEEYKGKNPDQKMMRQIVDIMREKDVFASVDVHNNTGLNPHYGCINKLDQRFFHLATQFSRTVVYFIRPKGVQSMAFAELCTAVTVECGKPDQPNGAAHAADFINGCLHLSEIPEHPIAAHDMDLFHTVATVSIPEDIQIRFADSNAEQIEENEICFLPDLDHLNFHELDAGICLGFVNPERTGIPLQVINEQGEEVTHDFFRLRDGQLQTARDVMPSMFTLDIEVIRQDCLGYLMERMDWQSL